MAVQHLEDGSGQAYCEACAFVGSIRDERETAMNDDALHLSTEQHEMGCSEIRGSLCDECYLDMKLMGRTILTRCPFCQRKIEGGPR